jgi:protein-tyrosine phosphatase
MFDEVFEGIFVGEAAALRDEAGVQREGITAIVRLDQIPRANGQWTDTFTLLDKPIPDAQYLDGDTIDEITSFIDEQIASGGKVLVHCHMGVSRSVSVVMAYLIAYEGMSLGEAFGTLREGRASAYPHEMLLVSLIERYRLPYDVGTVYNPQFLANLAADV